jgi:hypothetical protein
MDEPPPGLLKVCVFCGERPVDKTKEHVLPLWLIELTGDPKRQARFDIDWSKKPPDFRYFSFDQFTAPACSDCNSAFATLEDETIPIVQRLLAAGPLGAADLEVLLNWLDKVRIGLWLAKYLLDKNMFGIEPNYHIASRIGASDRAVIIFRHSRRIPRLSFIGASTPCFQLNPVAIALLINEYVIISVAHVTLCSRRLGFPFVEPVRLHRIGFTEGRVRAGLGRIIDPIIPHFPHHGGTGIYQPILRNAESTPAVSELFDTEYCRSNSLKGCGVGGIFQQVNGGVEKLSNEPNTAWLPGVITFGRAVQIATNFVHDEQLRVFTQGLPLWAPEERGHLREKAGKIRKIHNHFRKMAAKARALEDLYSSA